MRLVSGFPYRIVVGDMDTDVHGKNRLRLHLTDSRIRYLLAVLSLGTAAWIRIAYIPRSTILWDEAGHLQWPYELWKALHAGQWGQLADITTRQFIAPPFQSWALGLLMYPFDFTVNSVRTVNLLWFVGSVFLIYQIPRMLSARGGKAAGLTAVYLYATSPVFLFFAGVAMIEPMTVFLTLATAYAYLSGMEKPWHRLLSVSLLLFILTMTKYNHGIIIALAIILNEGIEFLRTKHKVSVIMRVLVIMLPYGIPFLGWIFLPENKLPQFLSVMSNSFDYLAGVGSMTDKLLYYPLAIIYQFSASPVTGILVLLSLFLALRHFSDRKMRFLWLAPVINIGLGIIQSHNVQERYIITVIPLLYILAALEWTGVFLFLARLRSPAVRIVLGAVSVLAAAVVFMDLTGLPRLVYGTGAYVSRAPVFNQTDYRDQIFEYDRNTWPHALPSPGTAMPQDVITDAAAAVDLSKPMWFIGETNELGQPLKYLLFDIYRNHHPANPQPYKSYAVAITVDPSSRLYTRDFRVINEWKQWELSKVAGNPAYALVLEKPYTGLGITLRIYGEK